MGTADGMTMSNCIAGSKNTKVTCSRMDEEQAGTNNARDSWMHVGDDMELGHDGQWQQTKPIKV